MAGVLTVVLYFYFLYDSERLAGGALWLVPPAWRERVRSMALHVRPMLRRYVVGLVAVVPFTSVASWVWLAPVMGVPHAELLALTTGLLELIPVAGPIASAALVSTAALGRGGVPALLAFLVFYIILRLLIDQVVGPLILGRAAQFAPGRGAVRLPGGRGALRSPWRPPGRAVGRRGQDGARGLLRKQRD